MALYAIGDIQGCYSSFRKLLKKLAFEPATDRLWVVGDMVNRGPLSVDVIRWLRDHDECVTAVLGNHDLHLLGRAAGVRKAKSKDTLDELLDAPDASELLQWVRSRPVLHREGSLVLVHAGILPTWTVEQALERAAELERGLRGEAWRRVLAAVFAKGPADWTNDPRAERRWRSLAAIFTRMRTCTVAGAPVFGYAGPPQDAPDGLVPWFRVPGRRSADHTVVFGHWAALGLHFEPGVVATDSACVWGQQLTAVRLPDQAVVQVFNCE